MFGAFATLTGGSRQLDEAVSSESLCFTLRWSRAQRTEAKCYWSRKDPALDSRKP